MTIARSKMPPNAKSVFKGKIFEVWQWEQKMFDGSIEIFERLRRTNSVIVITTVGDKILIQRELQPDREVPFLTMPGGCVDDGEDPLSAAKRELLEETGYESSDWTLLNEFRPYHKIDWTVYLFVARQGHKIQVPHLDAGEKITSRLVNFEEFLMLSEDESMRNKELMEILLRARLDPKKKEELRKLLF